MKTLKDLLLGASLGTVLAGKSIIDYSNLQIDSLEEAQAFIDCYGYDLIEDREEVSELRQQAIDFLKNTILDNRLQIPQSVLQMEDIRYYLLWASSTKKSAKALWSCALLRIIHTIAHCHSFFNQHYHNQIRQQILSRLDKLVEETEQGLMIGDIELADFQCRPLKSGESVTIKLLHKPENVTADIFDWIGVRFVTRYRLDAIRVLSLLREQNAVMFANVKPSRSRNTLIDLDWLQQNQYLGSYEELRDRMQQTDFPEEQGQPVSNFYSKSSYHALQFTCRQRIKIIDDNGQRISFFFPFEIQIMDDTSFQQSRMGDASHYKYKLRQLEGVRKRVLGPLYRKLEKPSGD